MATTNYDRVTRMLASLKTGLGAFVEREFIATYDSDALREANRYVDDDRLNTSRPFSEWDAAALLRLMWEAWREIFEKTLGRAERTLIAELRDVRNKWAHQETFTSDDAYRALDSAGRLLAAVSAPEAMEVEKAKMELLRVRFDEQRRTEKRKQKSVPIESLATGNLKAWREVITPHKDVASGRYQQAEFAADLWQVHLGEGTDEYRDPVEFYRRTFLTESLTRMLTGAVERISGSGGDPVVQLQTNFGGGKTHSMLALYHLFSGAPTGDLLGVDSILDAAGAKSLPKVNRVVLVGNKVSPGSPITKPDGTEVHTLWGELAWQLGGREAYERVREDDRRATSPGDMLRTLFNDYGPCLILIDEWVAYARQLHEESDLPAGSFETQFTFAQALTESARAAKNCMLVISLPASDTAGSPHTHSDDAEVGGQRGREALNRLRNVVGRVESSWRPASAEEGFEIVRRRLFEPLAEREQYTARDNVAREFSDFYRTNEEHFPPDSRGGDYEKRIKDAYPIHPEVFDRLYTDWSTLLKFQRTRGVLRLMAAVIHCLWEKGDKNPLILPASIPIDDDRVQFEMMRNLTDNWAPVIEKDIDGHGSLPMRIDNEVSNLGKYAACRRVARTVYMGSAPLTTAANRGLEDRRVKLGSVMPGEPPRVFDDALRRLAGTATYLYQDGVRYWYSTQPTVTKLAEDRAEQLARDPDKVAKEIERRVRKDVSKTGEFAGVHTFPMSSEDVRDDLDARLVVLGIDHPHQKDTDSPALMEAKAILESRGNSPRLFRNTLVFLAADRSRLDDLDEAVRRYLAWDSILEEKGELNLDPHQEKSASAQKENADSVVAGRVPEAFQWLLVPVQKKPDDEVEWETYRLSGQDPLVVRASKKLIDKSLLRPTFPPTLLKHELDKVPLWRGNHVAIKQLVEDFAQYLYLPRLKEPEVLLKAVRYGVESQSWLQDAYAFADLYDEDEGRYRGLRTQTHVTVSASDPAGLLVKSDVALEQRKEDEEAASKATGSGSGGMAASGGDAGTSGPGEPTPPPDKRPTRYHGSVPLNPSFAGRDAGRIAEEVLAHLAGLERAEVEVTLEIEAKVSGGVPENVVRTVSENSRTLKFISFGFEEE